jgi:hypothetical protein
MKCVRCNEEHDGSFGSGKYCNRACANSRVFSEEAKIKKSVSNKGNTPWNKGNTHPLETSKCVYCGIDIKHRKCSPKKYHPECWKKAAGGYRKGAGLGKSGWYGDVWCDSSYELAWVIYQIEHNIPFKRNTEKYEYQWDGKTLNYIPDFIQNESVIEIKGFMNSQTEAKLNTIPNLKILFRKDLNDVFEYVEKNYGKDFIRLYEGNPYQQYTGKCKLCSKPCKQKNTYCSRKCSGAGNNRNSRLQKHIVG